MAHVLKSSSDVKRVLLRVMLNYHRGYSFDNYMNLDNAFTEDGYTFPKGLPNQVVGEFLRGRLVHDRIIMGRRADYKLTQKGIEAAEREEGNLTLQDSDGDLASVMTSAEVANLLLRVMVDNCRKVGANEEINPADLLEKYGHKFSKKSLEPAVSKLLQDHLIGISMTIDGSDKTLYHLNQNMDVIRQRISDVGENIPSAPASDRIVSLDHNEERYKQMVKFFDDAIVKLDGINENLGEKFDYSKRDFKFGRDLLNRNSISRSRFSNFILKPLKYLSTKTSDISVKKILEEALNAIMNFFT